MHRQSRLPNLRAHRAVLSLFIILTIIFSWPLIGRIFTHVPGVAQWAFDESTFVWNIWYFKHSVVDQLSSPLHSDLIYYPLGIDLVLYTYNFFHAILSQPLFLATNLPFASNVSLLFSTIMSGYGTFLLVRYLLGKEEIKRAESKRLANRSTSDSPNLSGIPSPLHLFTSSPLFLAPIIAGILYAFASNRAIYAALGHYDMVTTQWIPFYALTLLRSLDQQLTSRQRTKSALLAGIFFAFNGLAEMITALFLAIFTIIVVLHFLFTNRGISDKRTDNSGPTHLITLSPLHLVISLLVVGITAFTLWSPALLPILTQFLTNDFSLKGWGEAIPLSTDLLGWFTPSALHPIFGVDLIPELRAIQLRALANDPGPVGFRDLNTVFLGWITPALALIGALLFWKRVRIWAWTSILFGLFTLGPFLQINGQYRFNLDGVDATFPMPYALLHFIPIIKANRAPNRNSVILMLGLAVLAAYTINAIFNRLAQTRRSPFTIRSSPFTIAVAVILAALILFEHMTIPLPLSDARVPDVYAQIAADPAEVAVMHLPLGWRNSFGTFGAERTRLQYYQTTHGKPMLGGNISRAPDFKMDYFRRLPFFSVLADIEAGTPVAPERINAARAQADELMQLYNVGYVLFMPPIEQRFPYADTWQATWDFAKETLPLEAEPFWTQDGIEAYKITQNNSTLSEKFKLDLGTPGTFAYRAEGWDAAEIDEPYQTSATWATPLNRLSSRLFLPLKNVDPNAAYTLTTRVRPFVLPQSVGVRINGQLLDVQPMIDDWKELMWAIPSSVAQAGINDVELIWQRVDVPRQFNPGSRQIGSTGVDLPVDMDINAFAEGGFIALFDDETGEQTDASAGRRGVNVTVLDSAGEVIEMVGFDTAANEFESEKLAEFLRGVGPNQPILIASNGDATAFLTEPAIDALRGIGADLSLDSLRTNSFAIVGVQGAAAGSAAVVVDPNKAFLRITLNRDRRPLAAAVDWVELKP